jgi:hypothetical protein
LNNIAVAAKHAIYTRQAERVFILDWDIHHGNGIQDICYNDPVSHMSSVKCVAMLCAFAHTSTHRTFSIAPYIASAMRLTGSTPALATHTKSVAAVDLAPTSTLLGRAVWATWNTQRLSAI